MSENEGELISVGSQKREVSVQVVQDVYHSLTGRTEVLSRYLFDNHSATLDDFIQLHSLIEQAIEPYSIMGSNCSVTVRYSDGKSETYSSFSRFESVGHTRNVCTEEFEIDYDFLIKLPKTSEPRPYNVMVNLRSTLGVVNSHDLKSSTEMSKRIFYNYDNATARYIIKYVDVAVARAIEAQIEEWYSNIERNRKSSVEKFFRSHARTAGSVVRVISFGVSAWFLLWYFSDVTFSLESLFRAITIGFTSLFVVGVIGVKVESKIADWLERLVPLSVIRLSKADDQALKKYSQRPIESILKTSFAALVSVGLGLVTTITASWLGF